MDFMDFPMIHSPNSNGYEDLFGSESICIDEEVNSIINPDDFLNLDQFADQLQDHAIKTESSPINSGMECQYTYTNHSSQQLTPPISPQPSSSIILDNSIFQRIKLIPVTALQHRLNPAKKVKTIVPKPSSSSDSDSNTIATSSTKSNSPVDKALIKQQRQMRNRESAVLSRNRKKEYVQTLEAQNADLRKENTVLKAENSQLKDRLKNYTLLTCRCASSFSTKLPSKNATFMLAVLFMVGFNVVPFGNLFIKNIQKPIVSQQFNTRHLLFVENATSSLNATMPEDVAVQDDPVYFNQTEHIRKVNIDNIRRWIPEPDLFNVSYLKTDFDFNPDPLQEKITKMFEKSREQSQKHIKNKKRLPKKKPSIERPVQLYNSNMNIIKLNEFFDEINRKDDTFYVFSFKADHLLLPAIDNSYNFSQIKMNLIMPRINGSSSSDKITMMQIETIIVNTSLIQITEKSIPENFLKPNMNTTTCNESQVNAKVHDESKTNFNDTTSSHDDFEPLTKTAKFPSYFNTLDLLKANAKK